MSPNISNADVDITQDDDESRAREPNQGHLPQEIALWTNPLADVAFASQVKTCAKCSNETNCSP